MYCICCKKDNVLPILHSIEETEEGMLWKKGNSNINNEMISNGIIHIIEAGYGSKYDCDKLIIAICDDCIKENLEDATLLYYDHTGAFYPDMIREDIEKSKKVYRRRKNLDKLV